MLNTDAKTIERPGPIFPLAAPQDALGQDYRTRFIASAPNGGRRTKADHPALPTTPEELAQTAKTCLEAGAAMIHVHVRDTAGRHILDADAYHTAIRAIRSACGDNLVLQITTEALGIFATDAQRNIVRDVKPEAASLAFRELARDKNDEQHFAELLLWMRQAGIAPQIIIYDTDDLNRFQTFLQHYDFTAQEFSMLYVLGRYTETPQGLHQLLRFANFPGVHFRDIMVCAFGSEETACVTAAALFGANARVGFENNLWLPSGETAANNATLIASTRSALTKVGLEIGDANRLRRLWGL